LALARHQPCPVDGNEEGRLMNTSQKESTGAARRSGSRLMSVHARAAKAAAVLLAALLMQAPALGAQGAGRQAGPAAKTSGAADDDKVPVRISVEGTKDEPYLVAQIGDFPFDLDAAGQQFLKQEFFEHFFADTFGLDISEVRSTVKIKLLPQTKELEREGEFTFGGITGRMHVVVAKRSVLVTCKFTERVKLDKGSLASFSRAALPNG
jgi:hypothetical protein